jgi:hypothetical protein
VVLLVCVGTAAALDAVLCSECVGAIRDEHAVISRGVADRRMAN